MRSHAWYHGPIPRHRAEGIVTKDGDFLIRDCTSQPGNYVLTCRTKDSTLHFVINKLVQQRDTVYERVQFQFEDDAYDSVADLITYYVGSGRSISAASGARIQTPCNRSYPLSFYATKYGTSGTHGNGINMEGTVSIGGGPTPSNETRTLPPRLPAKHQKSPATKNGIEDRFKSLKVNTPPTIGVSSKFNSLPRPNTDQPLSVPWNYSVASPCPPPKPRNANANKKSDLSIDPRIYRGITYYTSGSDSGNGSGDSVHSSMAGEGAAVEGPQVRGVVIRNPKYIAHSASSVTLTNDYDAAQMEEYLEAMKFGDNESAAMACQFDLDNYETLLLPVSENKPLDNNALYTFRMMMFENAATIVAHHLTRADLKLVLGMDFSSPSTPCSGQGDLSSYRLHDKLNIFEHISLDHGRQFRLDLIERIQCMKLLVAVTILTCGSDEERAETLNKWIQIATEVKTAYGNLYGFSAIVLGINMPQIQNLRTTWHVLRQKFTDNAFLFEAKMRPMWKEMNEANYSQAPNTTIPYFIPYILIRDRCAEEILELRYDNDCSLFWACVQPWMVSSNDDGLGIIMSHLEASRNFINSLPTFKQNAHIFMKDSSIRHDELLEDAFR